MEICYRPTIDLLRNVPSTLGGEGQAYAIIQFSFPAEYELDTQAMALAPNIDYQGKVNSWTIPPTNDRLSINPPFTEPARCSP